VQTLQTSGPSQMTPAQEQAFWVPDLHNFPANQCHDLRIKREADNTYNSDGFHLYIHHTEGLTPERHCRVAYLLQFGKYIVKNRKGEFCFFATQGMNPYNLAGLAKIKKSAKAKEVLQDVIPFDDSIHWYKNFYQMISHYWSIGLNRNLNLVLLYLQVKEGITPTVASGLTKDLLESEY